MREEQIRRLRGSQGFREPPARGNRGVERGSGLRNHHRGGEREYRGMMEVKRERTRRLDQC